MKFALLLFAGLALAQGPPITINQTQVQGGIANDCLKVNSNKTLGQATCGGGGGGISTVAGTASEISVANGSSAPVVSVASTFDISGHTSTAPIKKGTSLPATCTVGQFFNKTNATATAVLYACTATNTWTAQGSTNTGDVVGPGSATDNAVTRFDSTTGKLIQNSTVIVDDSGNTTLPASAVLTAPGGVSTGTSPPTVTAGTGGAQGFAEGTVPSVCAASAVDCIYADSTQHGFLANFNNVGYLPLVQGPASWTTARVVSTNGTNGGKIADAGFLAADVVRAVAPGAGIARFAGSTQVATSAELSGDATTSGSNAVTVAKVAGVASATVLTRAIGFTLGDPTNSSALTTSYTAYVTVPFACTISAYNLLVDATDTTLRVKFWKIATGTAIPTVSQSISTNGLGVPSGTAVHSTTTSDFTTLAVTANDIVAMNVSVANTAKMINGVLQCGQ